VAPTWRNAARCRGAPGTWFVPEAEGHPIGRAQALALCRDCPVRPACLNDALVVPEWSLGVWAGTTEDERTAVRRALRAVITGGTDVRRSAVWERFAGDDELARAVARAVDATPAGALAIARSRAALAVIEAVALVARGDPAIAEAIAGRTDVARWVRIEAARVAGMVAPELGEVG